jgi:hypothetical protein
MSASKFNSPSKSGAAKLFFCAIWSAARPAARHPCGAFGRHAGAGDRTGKVILARLKIANAPGSMGARRERTLPVQMVCSAPPAIGCAIV